MLIKAFKEVFSRPAYVILAVIIFFVVLTVAVWLPNISFLSHTATSETFTLPQKIGIISSTFAGIQTNFTPLSRTLTVLVAFFFAINVSFFIFYILRAATLSREAGIGTSGFLLGLIGIGCASCGSVILSGIFGVGATAGFLGAFPLKGQEFGLLSLILLGFSTYLLAVKIINPLVCKAKPETLRTLVGKLPLWSKTAILLIFAFALGILLAI